MKLNRLSLACLEAVLSDPESGVGKPAMVLLEAIQGEGGCIPASTQWLRQVREITERHQVPLVVDEIQSVSAVLATFSPSSNPVSSPMQSCYRKPSAAATPSRYCFILSSTINGNPVPTQAHSGVTRSALVSGAATLEFIREGGCSNTSVPSATNCGGLLKLKTNMRVLVTCAGGTDAGRRAYRAEWPIRLPRSSTSSWRPGY